jgi:hypothetical protein
MISPTIHPPQAGRRRVSPPGLWYAIAAAAAGALASLLHGSDSRGWLLTAVVVAAAVVVQSFLRRRRRNRRALIEPPFVLVLVFFVWHFSFWAVYFVGLASDYRIVEYFSIEPSMITTAAWTCVAGLLALIAGIEAGLGRRRWVQPATEPPHQAAFYLAAVAGALLIVTYVAISGSKLHGNYSETFTEADPLRRLYNLGVVLVLATFAPMLMRPLKGAQRVAAITAGTSLVLASLYVGQRWILFTLVLLYLAARSVRGRTLPLVALLVLSLALVPTAVLVKDIRGGRVTSLATARSAIADRYTNPLVELPEELGQTFIPVAGAIALTDADRPLLGSSLKDATLTIVPSLGQVAGAGDDRPTYELARTYFPQRFATEGYTLGYSIVAELYRNFALPGVVLGLLALGWLVGRSYERYLATQSFQSLYLCFALVAVLVFGIRNDAYTWLRSAVWATAAVLLLGSAKHRGVPRR